MKEKQKTREELIAEVARLTSANENIVRVDADRMVQFSKILGAPKRNSYGDDVITYSWAQIFSEVGKLIGRLESNDWNKLLFEIQTRLANVESILFDDTNHEHHD